MSFFKTKATQEEVAITTSNYMSNSGFYAVKILAAIASVSKNGSTSVDFFVDYQGQEQVVYGNLRITNNDGSENKIGSRLFNQLLVIAGIDSVAEPVEADLPIGKKEAMKTVAILEDLSDIDVIMRIQNGYSVWNDAIQERQTIRSFFREGDNASAAEVLSDENIGADYEKDAKYEHNVSYENGLTAESVAAWIAGGRTGTAASTETTKAPSFGTRRFGKK